jgi:hypothetical protein
MSCQIPVTLLLAEDEASITACLLAQMQRAPFAGALVLTTAASLPSIPAAVISVPMMHWLALPGCLCCMPATDPRLILLRTLGTGVGVPCRPVDFIVIAVPASLSATVQRAMTSIAPLSDRLAYLRILEVSVT